MQLGLLTALRRGELAQLRRDHIRSDSDRSGIDGERFHLPRTITKTGAAHDVPLTPLMRSVIAAQPVTLSPLLLPSARTGTRLRGWGPLVAHFRQDSGVKFSLHDLRRTCRTLMSCLGVSEDIAELAIGHQRADLVARYNKDQAWPGRVAAFTKVSDHIAALLAGNEEGAANVVTLRRGSP